MMMTSAMITLTLTRRASDARLMSQLQHHQHNASAAAPPVTSLLRPTPMCRAQRQISPVLFVPDHLSWLPAAFCGNTASCLLA